MVFLIVLFGLILMVPLMLMSAALLMLALPFIVVFGFFSGLMQGFNGRK